MCNYTLNSVTSSIKKLNSVATVWSLNSISFDNEKKWGGVRNWCHDFSVFWPFGVLTLRASDIRCFGFRCFEPTHISNMAAAESNGKWDETVLIVTVRQQATFVLAAPMLTHIFDAICRDIALLRLRYIGAKFFNWTFIFISVDLCTSCQRTWYVWIHLHGNIVRSWYSPMSHCEGQAWGDIRECEVTEVWPLQWVVVLYILPCHIRPWYMSGMYSTGPHRNLDFQTPRCTAWPCGHDYTWLVPHRWDARAVWAGVGWNQQDHYQVNHNKSENYTIVCTRNLQLRYC